MDRLVLMCNIYIYIFFLFIYSFFILFFVFIINILLFGLLVMTNKAVHYWSKFYFICSVCNYSYIP